MGDKSKDEVRYDFTPWDGTPGPLYDKFDTALMNCASRSDDRGWSFADHLMGIDEGGPAGPAIAAAGGAAAQAKATTAFRKRQKESYGMLTRHITNQDIVEALKKDHFQDGHAAYNAVRADGNIAIDRLPSSSK